VKKKVICLAGLVLFFVVGLSCALATEVLFIVGNSTTLAAGDKALSDHLTGRGLTVIPKQQNKLQASDVIGHDLVVISHTVGASSVGKILKPLAVPIVCAEPTLFDDLGMTTNNGHGVLNAQQSVVAVQGDITQLSGTIAVSSSPQQMTWATPGRNAIIGAHLITDTAKAALFAYKQGATMPGLAKAPDRRVGVFVGPAMAPSLTASGWQLFDDACDYALLPEEQGCAAGEHAMKLASTCDVNIWIAASANNISPACTTDADCGGGTCIKSADGKNNVCKEVRCNATSECAGVNSWCNTLNPNFSTKCEVTANCNTGAKESCATDTKSYYNSKTDSCATNADCVTKYGAHSQCDTASDHRCYFYLCKFNECYHNPVPVTATHKTSTVCHTNADCTGGKFCYNPKGGATGTTGVCASVPADGNGWAMPKGAPDRNICVPAGWKGRFWARTGCTATNDGTDIVATCDTGTCLGGSTGQKNALHCLLGGTPNVTVAEFTFPNFTAAANHDFYDVSMVDAANVGIQVFPDPDTYNITTSSAIGGACTTNADCPTKGSPAYNWVCDTKLKKCVNRYECGAPGCVDARCDQYGIGGKYLGHSKWAGKDSGKYAVSQLACPAELEYKNASGAYVACINADKMCSTFGGASDARLACFTNIDYYRCTGTASESCLTKGATSTCCGCASWTKAFCASDNPNWQKKAGVYANIFHTASPTSYTYPFDDDISTFTCVGKSVDVNVDYTINFCPRPGVN